MASNQKAFTIVELMIAMAVMGVTMLLTTMGVIQISRYYKQGQAKTTLLNANRELHSQFAQDLQFSGYDPVTTTLTYATKQYTVICVGTSRYIYRIDPTNSFSDNTFAVEQIATAGGCTSPLTAASFSQTPMPPDTHVAEFSLPAPVNGVYTLTTRFVVANSGDIFKGTNPEKDFLTNDCMAAAIGADYCAVGSLRSTLVRKVAS